ncbi:KRAB-A domain-containing protein 2-like [Macrobrachium rosenbergii]|uniref:KRAB-A domain-containing protein 2-like n=1 Tax=Macrobrachium rosenbergii TaxID=79674 RepID=UPI0034D5C5CB
MQDLLRINFDGAKSAFDFNLKKRYEVLRVGSADRLICWRKYLNEDEFKFVSPLEEVFGIVKAADKAIGHGGDGDFKYIMTSVNYFSKFCVLCQLTTKRAEEVEANLLDIFLTFGAPAILQSDNRRELINVIIAELAALRPELKLVTGRPCHPQSVAFKDGNPRWGRTTGKGGAKRENAWWIVPEHVPATMTPRKGPHV